MLNLLADTGLRRTFGQAGRARVEQEFSYQLLVSRYEVLFANLLARRESMSW
jgi:hypothetical protein